MSDKLYRFTYQYEDYEEAKSELTRVEHVVTRQTETHIYFRDGEKEARCRRIYNDQPRLRVGNFRHNLHFEMMSWNPDIAVAKKTILEHIDRNIIERIRKAEEQLDAIVDFHEKFERHLQ